MTDILNPATSDAAESGTDKTPVVSDARTRRGTVVPLADGVPVVDGVALTGEQKAPPAGRVTWDEFLAWIDDTTRAEWVDGEVVILSPSNVEHLQIVGFLYRLLADFVEAHGLGEVFLLELLMKFEARRTGRMPDLLFIANEHADRLTGTLLDGPADLVVEVVSPESDRRDRSEKFAEYEAAGIPEYWLLDPIRRDAYFYELGDDGRYHAAPTRDGTYRSGVVRGFELREEWLWRRPLPIAEARRALGV